ncbi:hypothetical protein HHI36_013583 [Cryptolaemus montrouzieri]|uniref:Condensin complex subunit 2 n=1 Tax=Cryptolaemus montrouzieri TaxID=559131 RepID=A0ABD2NI48_9CUCU
MISSTPAVKKSDNLRRRTLLQMNDNLNSPIIRDPTNDESERSSRRSFIEMQKKMSSPQVAGSPSLNDSVRFSGEQEIKDHFQICTKLHAENKITPRVAWQLHIIDLLRVVSKKQSSDSLQVASTSLDIGAKVYSIRVDDIYTEGLKLANSMARLAQKDPAQDKENDNQDENEAAAGEGAGPQKRERRKLRYRGGPKNTVAKDPKNLLAPVPKLESVFFSTRIDSNLSTVENLFTNKLPMDKSCYKFMVMSKEKAWPNGPDEAVQSLEQSRDFEFEHLPKNGHICIPFQNFILDKWDPEEEEKNAENSISQQQDLLVYDDHGIPVPELDGSIHDIFNDNNDDMPDEDVEQDEEFAVQQMHHDIARVVDLIRPEEDFQRSEYSYNSIVKLNNGKVIDQIWAGPSHWKLKFLRRSRPRFSGIIEQQSAPKTKKKKIEPEPASLDDMDELEEMLNNMKRIKIKKKIFPASKVTLPLPVASCVNLLKEVHELMMKPGTVPVSKSNINNTNQLENQIVNDELEPPEADLDDGMGLDHGDNDFNEEEEIAMNQQQNFMGDNLVDAPEYVPKDYIPYTTQAKKMDMKKLKAHIWQLLTQNSMQETVIPTTYSKLYKDLPDILPQSMKLELSCPLAFSALLHLCNEHTLKLTQHSNYKDFTIESG